MVAPSGQLSMRDVAKVGIVTTPHLLTFHNGDCTFLFSLKAHTVPSKSDLTSLLTIHLPNSDKISK